MTRPVAAANTGKRPALAEKIKTVAYLFSLLFDSNNDFQTYIERKDLHEATRNRESPYVCLRSGRCLTISLVPSQAVGDKS